MVIKELLGPIDLFGAQDFYIHETAKIVMVHKNNNLVFATF